ncbi:PREDICTED: exosome component 10 [Ceratosolen solmsi marchali]|uniref:Exosome complex component 10 homolog n=1 Tax=Ceratosolen solmsi marchali TaxID=326594 RepID=A0AAJ6YC74_9HYME|nr:PREDICTED: exosome component 10 [Ceratosolen solmsi marchali]
MTSDNSIITIEDNSFNDFVQKSFSILKKGIKASNSLPNNENFNYYSCFPTFNEIKNEQIKKIMHSMQCIVRKAEISGNIKQRDIEEKFDLLLESNDTFLDRAVSNIFVIMISPDIQNACMDEEAGISRNQGVELIVTQAKLTKKLNGCWNNTVDKQTSTSSDPTQTVRLLAGKNIQRPQLTFKDKIDNSPMPWQPKIKYKPNSIKPLAIYLEDDDKEVFCHPYEWELDKFEPSEEQLVKKHPIKYKSLKETPLIIIEKLDDLKIILNDLENYNEIAIDLEHHSYRSFQGITCLMQISTRDTDYLIDTLTLRSELHVLNEIFTKPSILKVFHGAESDILWLQRDLSLYIVNMFDTHKAAKQLELPFLSLSYLLRTYCQIDPNKHFQLADWRIRPLPEELMKYAREDTHYLLYIKDILNNALIDVANGQTNILKAVYACSTNICKQTYEKPVWSEISYTAMYRKSQKMFNNRQLYALKELHKWRDETARSEDDSTHYVLPNHMLLNIAESLPREMQGILACCNPIPPLIRQNLLKIHKLILKAREQPLIKTVLNDDIIRLSQRSQISNSESWIWTPHDLPNDMEARENLPCLLNTTPNSLVSLNQIKLKPGITIFDNSSSEDECKDSVIESCKKPNKLIFVSPFERYKRVQPIIAEEEKKEREKQEKEAEKIREQIEKTARESIVSTENTDSKSDKTSQNPKHFVKDSRSSNLAQNDDVVDTIVKSHMQTLSKMQNKKRKRQLGPEIMRSNKKKKERQKGFKKNTDK